MIGFEPETGIHSDKRAIGSTAQKDFSDENLMREIDAFLADEKREQMPREDHLKKLLEYHDKAAMLHHPVAKIRRLKLLKQEIK